MAPARMKETKLTEAAARTAEVLQALQTRLHREMTAAAAEEPSDELGNQLKEYFAASAPASWNALTEPVPGDIRELVVEKVAEKILRAWDQPNAGLEALKNDVIARLVEHVLRELTKPSLPRQ